MAKVTIMKRRLRLTPTLPTLQGNWWRKLPVLCLICLRFPCGIDGLTANLLKRAGPSVFKPLTYIFNLSLCTHVFPECWKSTSVTPTYKEGSKSDPANYHTISLLPCLGKAMERLTHTQLYTYVESHDILPVSGWVQEGVFHVHLPGWLPGRYLPGGRPGRGLWGPLPGPKNSLWHCEFWHSTGETTTLWLEE